MRNSLIFGRILGGLQVFIAIGAIAGGVALLMDVSGAVMGFPQELLSTTPFPDYLLPGLYLLLVNGLGTLAAAILSFRRHPWAAEIGIAFGLALMGWITAQILWVGYISWMQPFYFVLGLLEGAFGAYLQRVRDKQLDVIH